MFLVIATVPILQPYRNQVATAKAAPCAGANGGYIYMLYIYMLYI